MGGWKDEGVVMGGVRRRALGRWEDGETERWRRWRDGEDGEMERWRGDETSLVVLEVTGAMVGPVLSVCLPWERRWFEVQAQALGSRPRDQFQPPSQSLFEKPEEIGREFVT